LPSNSNAAVNTIRVTNATLKRRTIGRNFGRKASGMKKPFYAARVVMK
jgi:hypothetical protein